MEDAFFIADKDFGLFDGVTGSRKASGQDLYSVQLCRQTQAMIESQRSRRGKVQVDYALEFAVGSLVDTMAVGSTTACVVTIDSQSEPGLTLLRGVNVGDSGLTLCRRPPAGGPLAVVYKTNPQMHYFNCPFQLGGSSPDTPDQCVRIACPLAPGDVLVIASDGLYDNIFDEQILQILESSAGQPPAAQAQLLVDAARAVQEDPSAVVPYGIEARAAGQSWEGGKLDDTAVLVVQFYAGDQAPVPPPPQATAAAGKAAPLPKGWEEAKDPSTGNVYYFRRDSGETTWTRPK